MVLDLTMSMAILALLGALATIAGCLEDLESDVGSQSNPNSQVQLAPQMGFLHRIYNKAISGEPISNGMSAVTGGTVTAVLLNASSTSVWYLCDDLICRQSCKPVQVQAAPVYGYYEIYDSFNNCA
jgi:tetrahydromethanopterin S-methyltransferase subunit E